MPFQMCSAKPNKPQRLWNERVCSENHLVSSTPITQPNLCAANGMFSFVFIILRDKARICRPLQIRTSYGVCVSCCFLDVSRRDRGSLKPTPNLKQQWICVFWNVLSWGIPFWVASCIITRSNSLTWRWHVDQWSVSRWKVPLRDQNVVAIRSEGGR